MSLPCSVSIPDDDDFTPMQATIVYHDEPEYDSDISGPSARKSMKQPIPLSEPEVAVPNRPHRNTHLSIAPTRPSSGSDSNDIDLASILNPKAQSPLSSKAESKLHTQLQTAQSHFGDFPPLPMTTTILGPRIA
ncbi:hypothetical protein EW146_g9553 [Bondarzewia mesenterica]|uniref:Uncharacterized protein n=1 Tax=Bondarzewia mesenterica TaxID=1095465 RepID=A0A4S4L5S5_9AGAM|nr:hypothetical protein EW146_g9553 [Bondarzewia mesenterica]